MKIGLFTDTYHPSVNGIVYVIDITKKHLEELGHEVFIFCPGGIRSKNEDEHIIHFPSVKGAFYDDNNLSLFFPPRVLRQIKALELDVIHFFTPGQVGLMAVYAANKYHIPIVAQHSTDVYEYVEHYPAVLPGLLMLAPLLPLTFRFHGKDAKQLLRLYMPRRGVNKWNRDIIEALISMVFSRCDAVIALSRKSQKQLKQWNKTTSYHFPITLMPTGINALPRVTQRELDEFRAQYDIDPRDELITYVGRLGAEKNLAILIPTIEKIVEKRPRARLLYVGDFEYRAELERLTRDSSVSGRITFTGALPRNELNKVYSNTGVFIFPSMTDTQGLVLHEAAHAGCPLVIIDAEVSEVLEPSKNGLKARNSATDIAKQTIHILSRPKLREKYSTHSKKRAQQFTERVQVNKLVKLYKDIIEAHQPKPARKGVLGWVRAKLSS